MASLRVHPDRLEIQLSAAEKALALRRDAISVPRSAIRSVTITDDPWIWIRGIRAPGALVPLVLATRPVPLYPRAPLATFTQSRMRPRRHRSDGLAS